MTDCMSGSVKEKIGSRSWTSRPSTWTGGRAAGTGRSCVWQLWETEWSLGVEADSGPIGPQLQQKRPTLGHTWQGPRGRVPWPAVVLAAAHQRFYETV